MSLRAIGHWLRDVRAGDAGLAWHHPQLQVPERIRLRSAAFECGAVMPARYAGSNGHSPPLAWSGVPEEAIELALIIEDPDAPLRRPVVHGIASGIAAASTGLSEDALRAPSSTLKLGRGFLGRIGYSGPRPVPGHGAHRYVFQLYAVAQPLRLPTAPTRRELIDALIAARVLARGRLDGRYER